MQAKWQQTQIYKKIGLDAPHHHTHTQDSCSWILMLMPSREIYAIIVLSEQVTRNYSPQIHNQWYETNSLILSRALMHSGLTGHCKPLSEDAKDSKTTGDMVCPHLISFLPKRIPPNRAIGRWGAWLGVSGSCLLIKTHVEGTQPSVLPVMPQVRHQCWLLKQNVTPVVCIWCIVYWDVLCLAKERN